MGVRKGRMKSSVGGGNCITVLAYYFITGQLWK